MAVDSINTPLLGSPLGTGPERAGVPPGRGANPERESREQAPGTTQDGNARYRVDDAYRAYAESRKNAPPPRADRESGDPRRFRSAELLGSMIHQMGGGVTSSAKGMFVDIAI